MSATHRRYPWMPLAVIAASTLLSCAQTPAADPSAPLNGGVEGREFKLVQGHGRAANASGGLAVDLADYSLTCGLMAEGASEGSRFVSVVLSEATAPGTYQLSDTVLGGAVSASVTTWQKGSDGYLQAKSLLLTEGTVRIDRADAESIQGVVELRTGADTSLAGTFSAPRCPTPGH